MQRYMIVSRKGAKAKAKRQRSEAQRALALGAFVKQRRLLLLVQTQEILSTNWHGNLNLVFALADDKTVLSQNQVQAPLKVLRPFYPEGSDVCHSVILHTAGGVVGGDRLDLNFHLEQKAKALITTGSAGKIYRSNGLQAKQNIQIQVEADACLEFLPQETIVFDGAIYRQDLRVELAPKSCWLGWEITRFGRSARGERFLHGEWRSHTEVWQQGNPLWIDRQWLPGNEEIINSPHGLAGQSVVASLVWIGEPVSPEIVETARNLWTKTLKTQKHPPSDTLPSLQHASCYNGGNPRNALAPPASSPSIGVTRLGCGLLCRYRGSSTAVVKSWFMDVWQMLRLSFLARPRCIPRVWQI